MTIRHDFRCQSCGNWDEVLYAGVAEIGEVFQRKGICSACGGVTIHTWRTAPGLGGVTEPGTRGVTKTFHPGAYDVQAGRRFDSLVERESYLKSRGLVALGPDEYKRTIATTNEPQPDFSTLPETMKEAWGELEAGKPAPPIAVMDENGNVTDKELKNG